MTLWSDTKEILPIRLPAFLPLTPILLWFFRILAVIQGQGLEYG